MQTEQVAEFLPREPLRGRGRGRTRLQGPQGEVARRSRRGKSSLRRGLKAPENRERRSASAGNRWCVTVCKTRSSDVWCWSGWQPGAKKPLEQSSGFFLFPPASRWEMREGRARTAGGEIVSGRVSAAVFARSSSEALWPVTCLDAVSSLH